MTTSISYSKYLTVGCVLLFLLGTTTITEAGKKKGKDFKKSQISIDHVSTDVWDVVHKRWQPRYPGYARTKQYRESKTPRRQDVHVQPHQKSGPGALKDGWKVNGKPEKITFEVGVPSDYTGDVPYGLFVYASPSNKGGVPGKNYDEILKKHRLIYIGANNAQNGQPSLWREILTLEAALQGIKKYNIDPDRVYIAGMSGGGRVASRMIIMHPEVFKGSISIVGSDHYGGMKIKNGNIYGFWEKGDPRVIRQAQQNRQVILAGEKDHNQWLDKIAIDFYKLKRFPYVHYLEVPGMGHVMPPNEWIDKSIVLLDAPLLKAARTEYTKSVRLMDAGRLGMAYPGLKKAAAHGAGEDWHADAKQRYAKLTEQREQAIATVKTHIENEELVEAGKALALLKRDWGRTVADEARELGTAIAEARRK